MKSFLILALFALFVFECNNKASTTNLQIGNEVISDSSVNQNLYIKNSTVLKNGVLRIKTDLLEGTSDTIYIYNSDHTLFGAIFSENEEEEPAFNGNDSLNIRSYYPEYYIVIMDSDELINGKYPVIINGSKKYVEHKAGVTVYETWSNHLKNSYIVTTKENPLRETAEEKDNLLGEYDYRKLSFLALEVNGDWVKVVCDFECEGCPDQKKITGWLRWKTNEVLLIKLYYAC